MKEKIVPYLKKENVIRVLDYGCGKFLRDSLYLTTKGFIVDSVDIPSQIKRMSLEKILKINEVSPNIPEKDYDAALLNYVLQVIETPEKRKKVLKKVLSSVKEKGCLVLSLRNRKSVKNLKNPIRYNDGYITQDKTFVRGYTQKEAEKILSEKNKIINTYTTYTANIFLVKKF